jgi:hypothetical protein
LASRDAVESLRVFNSQRFIVAKQAAIREVKSMTMSCDPVGNLLLVKFSFGPGSEACVFMPAHIVFWLLDHFPVNQDPNLAPPPALPQMYAEDWDDEVTPRIFTVQCKQFADAIRMTMNLEGKPDLVVLLNRTNVELMRQFMLTYKPSLMDLDVF